MEMPFKTIVNRQSKIENSKVRRFETPIALSDDPETGTGSGGATSLAHCDNAQILRDWNPPNSAILKQVWARGQRKKDIPMLCLRLLSKS